MADADKIKRLLDDGLTSYGLGQVDEALSMWREVLALEPGNARAIEYIQFVESNWTPSQPRETMPYRPDQGSDEINVQDVPAPGPTSDAGTAPPAASVETQPAPNPEAQEDSKPEAQAEPEPLLSPAADPAAQVVPEAPVTPAFIEPFKSTLQPGSWGELYDFNKNKGSGGKAKVPAPPMPSPAPAAPLEEENLWSVWTPGPDMLPEPLPTMPEPQAAPTMPEPQAAPTMPEPKPKPPAFPPLPSLPNPVQEPAPVPEPALAPEVPAFVAPGALELQEPEVAAPELEQPAPSAQDGWGAVTKAPEPVVVPEPVVPPELATPAEPVVKINPVPPFAKRLDSELPSSGGALDLVGGGGSPAWATETPRPAKSLIQGARDMLYLDDFSGAVELLEKAAEREPDNNEVAQLLESAQGKLERHLRVKLGDTSRLPQVRMSGDEIIWLNLDHRAGFLLSLIDGHTSIDDLLSICGLPMIDAMRIIVQLLDEKVVSSD